MNKGDDGALAPHPFVIKGPMNMIDHRTNLIEFGTGPLALPVRLFTKGKTVGRNSVPV